VGNKSKLGKADYDFVIRACSLWLPPGAVIAGPEAIQAGCAGLPAGNHPDRRYSPHFIMDRRIKSGDDELRVIKLISVIPGREPRSRVYPRST
jgi:hypothetical protein